MLERLARQTVLNLDAYEWEASSEVVAARHGLDPRDVIRFDLNTSPFPPASWDAAMEGARLERIPNESRDWSWDSTADALDIRRQASSFSGIAEWDDEQQTERVPYLRQHGKNTRDSL